MLAEVIEGDVEPVHRVVANGGSDDDVAGRGHLVNARSDVDPVAVQLALVDQNVVDIDADAQGEPLVAGRNVGVRHLVLDLGRPANGIGRAAELDEQAVTDDTQQLATVRPDRGLDDADASALPFLHGGDIVDLDAAGEAGDIGEGDRRKPALETFGRRRSLPHGCDSRSLCRWWKAPHASR